MAVPDPNSHRLEREFVVGHYVVDPSLQRVSADGKSVQLEPKVMEVLLLLAAHHGRLVSKEQFLTEVWGDTVVTDDALLRCISELRKVFGDDPRNPSYIETIRKRGYRLIARVEERPATRTADARPDGAARETAWPTIWLAVSVTAIATMVLIFILQPQRDVLPARPLMAIPLTSYAGEETAPRFSPDGERVAFVWDGGTGGARDVYIAQPGASTPVRFTTSAFDDFSPSWTPDGREVIFVRAESTSFRILSKPLAAASERELLQLRARDVSDAAVSPDGRMLAVSLRSEGGGPYAIDLIDLETGERRPASQPPSDYLGDRQAAFSPDGRRLAFVRSVVEKVDDLFVLRLDQGEVNRVTSDHTEVAGSDWTSDGSQLIYSSNREGLSTLWSVPSSGGRSTWMPISTEGSGVAQLSVARNHRKMAVVIRNDETNIWSMPIGADSSAASTVVASTRMDSDPDVSPDNRRLAFVSNRLGNYEVWFSNVDGSNPIQFTDLNGAFTSTPDWGPQADRIAFVARSNGQIDVYIADVLGGRVRRVTTAGSNDRQPQWSRDGRWVYFASNRSGDWEIWRRPVDGDEPERITQNGGFAAMESVDGTWLYFMKRDEPGIWRMRMRASTEERRSEDSPRVGGPAELVQPGVATFDWGNWTINRTGLYFVRRGPEGVEVHRRPPEADSSYVVAILNHLPKEPALSIAPDGRTIYFTRADRMGSDIVVVEDYARR